MSHYTCPTCGETMQRDMLLLYQHTDRHVVDEIKKKHPQWVNEDGYCEKCVNYYKTEMKRPETTPSDSAETVFANIGMKGVVFRLIGGTVIFAAAIALFFLFYSGGYSRQMRLVLFIPFFFAMLGMLQSKNQVCVAHGFTGTCDMGQGRVKVDDPHLKAKLEATSIKIVLIAAFISVLLTAGMFFL